MNEAYKQHLIVKAKTLQFYRKRTDCDDKILLSKIDHLIGYILALEEEK